MEISNAVKSQLRDEEAVFPSEAAGRPDVFQVSYKLLNDDKIIYNKLN